MKAHQRAFVTTLVVALVVLSVLADSGAATQRVATGTVAEIHVGDWMLVANECMRLAVALDETTAYEGDPAALEPGVRVIVWYRSVAERRPVADKVIVFPDTARR